MDAREIAAAVHPEATVRELAGGDNRVFRVQQSDNLSTIIKVYPVASRERRERHALEALEGVPAVPRILNSGSTEDIAWIEMNDGGRWNLASLPKNLETVGNAGGALRGIHSASANITNLAAGIDSDYLVSHFRSTIERLGRYRRRFEMKQAVLDQALEMEPPLATHPVPSHTKPVLSKFVVDDAGNVMIVDWEWATLAPAELDLTFTVWQLAGKVGEDAAAAFREGYGAELPESRYRSWVAYHSAVMMLEAANVREGRLGDLSYLVDDLTEAVIGT